MSKRPLDASWTNWLTENLARNCPPQELLGILLDSEFTVESIRQAMGDRFPENSPLLGAEASRIDYRGIADVAIVGGKQFAADKLQLYTIQDFLSHDECDELVMISALNLRPSTITTGDRDRGYRTRTTCELSLISDPVVAKIDERIAHALGIQLSYSECIQAQRYEVGQQFKQHTDYFEPGTTEYDKFANSMGNRTWTFMVYLNEVERGGGTRFIAVDHTIQPQKGMAVVWNNLNPDGTTNPFTLHAGLPVEAGFKVVITKWFREIGSGPMFYNR
ncbi:MAG: 2OG-Fe(II) oxygenase [Pirellula sp.]